MPPKLTPKGKQTGKKDEKGLQLKLQLQEEEERKRQIQENLRQKLDKEKKEHEVRKYFLREGTRKHFEGVFKKVNEQKAFKTELEEWNRYLDLKPKPSPFAPNSLRDYLFKWQQRDEEKFKNSFDPLLEFDERSILTQDIKKPNLTQKYFKKNRPNLGDPYVERITEVVKVIDEINEVLTGEKVRVKPRVRKDIHELQLFIRNVLREFIDLWSLTVLSNIDRDMEMIDPISADYFHDGNLIKLHIWTFRTVPLPPNHQDVNNISLKSLKAEYVNSTEINLESCAIRSLYYDYDHYSDLVPSYSLKKFNIPKKLSLAQTVEHELSLSEKFRNEKLDKMRAVREDYEQKLQRVSVSSVKKQSIPEPPIVTEDTVVDVEDELVKALETEFIEHREKLNPSHLGLSSKDINLREYSIVGGVFEINLLERPRQPRYSKGPTVVRIYDESNTKLHDTDFHFDYIELPKPRKSLVEPAKQRRKTLFPQDVQIKGPHKGTFGGFDTEEEERQWLNENELNQRKLFEVKIKLPEDVYWWTAPKVCRWQPWTESEEFLALSPDMQNFNVNYDKIMEEQRSRLFSPPPVKMNYLEPKFIQDYPLSQKQPGVSSYFLIRDFILPRIPDDYLFYSERLERKAEELLKKQFKLKQSEDIQANEFETVKDSKVVRTQVVKGTPPNYLYPENPKIRPLHIINQPDSIDPTRKDSNESINENEAYLSEFIAHLDKLQARAQPFLNKDSEVKQQKENHLNIRKNSKQNLTLIQHAPGTWSSKEVHCIEFDPDTNTISFKAGKFGVFAFYTSRYLNLPFKGWEMGPVDGAEQTVMVTLKLQYTKIDFEVTSNGIKCGIHMKTKSFMTELVPIMKEYLDLKELQRVLKSYNIDVFPETDASHYVLEHCEKLAALEEHTFKGMAVFCMTHTFSSCLWNRFASYREILLKAKMLKPQIDEREEKEVLLTTRSAYYVHTTQRCSDEKCIFNLNPPGQNFNPDLFNLLDQGLPTSLRSNTFNKTEPLLKWNLYELLKSLKIFSFTVK